MPKLLTAFFLLLILILGAVFVWWPKYQAFNELKMEIRTKEFELQNKEEYFAKLNQLAERIRDHLLEFSKINSALPPDSAVSALFNFLEKESSRNGLVLRDINIGKTSAFKEGPEIKQTSLSLFLVGPYSAFKNFLSNLHNSARMIEVESISFSTPEKGEIFNFNLGIKTYSYY